MGAQPFSDVSPIEDRHFTLPEHWRLFRAIVASLAGALPQALGNATFIAELTAEAPELAAVPAHAAAVRDAWVRRQLVHIAFAMATNATGNMGLSGAEALALAESRLAALHPPAVASLPTSRAGRSRWCSIPPASATSLARLRSAHTIWPRCRFARRLGWASGRGRRFSTR